MSLYSRLAFFMDPSLLNHSPKIFPAIFSRRCQSFIAPSVYETAKASPTRSVNREDMFRIVAAEMDKIKAM